MAAKNIGLVELKARFKPEDFDEVSRPFFEQAISETALPICIADPNLPDSPIVYVNDAFTKLTGYEAEEIVGRNCRFLQGPGTTEESLINLRAALKKKYLSVTELVNYRKDGSAFLNALHMAPLFDTTGKMQLFYGSQMDTTEAITVEHVRRQRALKIAGVGIWEYHPDEDESFADPSMLKLFDMDEDVKNDLFRKFMSKVHPEDKHIVLKATAASFDDPRIPYNVDFRILRADGKVRWIRSVGGMANAGSGYRSFIGVSSDVTDEKELEIALSEARDTIQTVADELDHRMNNVFATMAALVSAGARGEPDSKKAAKKTRDRIMALATANRLTIGKGIDSEASLQALLHGALEPYRGTADIEIEKFDLPLSQRTLQSLGLIFHELSTNSVKYGALNSARGRLLIGWTVTKDGNCEINWREINGEKTDCEVQSSGFGARLMDLTIKQIGGDLQRVFHDEGIEVQLSFPLISNFK